MGVKSITYRNAPVDIQPLRDRITELESEVLALKEKDILIEAEVEKLKP